MGKTNGTAGGKIATDGIARLPLVRLRRKVEENKRDNIKSVKGLNKDDSYAVWGEAGDTRTYILLNMRTGRILAGSYSLDRFENAT